MVRQKKNSKRIRRKPLQKPTLPHQTLAEFASGTIPVTRIVWVKSAPEDAEAISGGGMPIALLDLSGHPDFNLGDLAQQGVFDRDAATEFDWAIAERAEDILLCLTCTYFSPTQGQFSLLFSYRQHHGFVRWMLEHDNLLPLATGEWFEAHGSGTLQVLLSAEDDELAGSLSIMLMHQMLTRQHHTPSQEEMVRLLLDVRRYISLDELSDFARNVLHLTIRGEEEQMVQNATEGESAALIVRKISRGFRVLLLQVLVLDGITCGLYREELHFFTEEWLAE